MARTHASLTRAGLSRMCPASNFDELVLVGEPPPSRLTIQSSMRSLRMAQRDFWRSTHAGSRSLLRKQPVALYVAVRTSRVRASA